MMVLAVAEVEDLAFCHGVRGSFADEVVEVAWL